MMTAGSDLRSEDSEKLVMADKGYADLSRELSESSQKQFSKKKETVMICYSVLKMWRDKKTTFSMTIGVIELSLRGGLLHSMVENMIQGHKEAVGKIPFQ